MIKRNIRDSYPLYKQIAKEPIADLKDYTSLTGEYNEFLVESARKGHKVALPFRLGSLEIEGKKQKASISENGEIKGLAPDWQRTKQLWQNNPEAAAKKQLVYHSNSHSGKMRYKYLWSKKNVLVANKTLYSLVLTRANKRALAREIKNGKEY
jgi:hypothetical protein